MRSIPHLRESFGIAVFRNFAIPECGNLGASANPGTRPLRIFSNEFVRWICIGAFAGVSFALAGGCSIMTSPTQEERARDSIEYLPLLPTEELAAYSRMEPHEDPDRILYEYVTPEK